jgi:hypothetical protein
LTHKSASSDLDASMEYPAAVKAGNEPPLPGSALVSDVVRLALAEIERTFPPRRVGSSSATWSSSPKL